MSSTFTQMVSTVQRLVGNHSLATSTVVGEAVNKQHSDLLEAYDWSRKKQNIIIATVADKTAGTIDVTNGSAAISGTSTAFASTDVNRTLRINYSLYTVNSYTSATSISLGDTNGSAVLYPGDTDTGLSYVLFTQRYSVGTGIEQILSVKYQAKIDEVSEEYLDAIDAYRSATASTPRFFARSFRGSSDDVQIEIYPRPSSPIAVNVEILKGHTDLSGSNKPLVPSGPIEWFAAEHTCYYLHAKTKDDKRWLTLAANYQARGKASLEFELTQDAKKFGVIQQVQDTAGGTGLGMTDFGLDHDTGVN